MPGFISVNKQSEFFIAIAKERKHHFIMLGVIANGKAEFLAREGGGGPSEKNFVTIGGKQFTLFGKAPGNPLSASLMEESIGEEQGFVSNISYQAYSISYEHYREFLTIIKDMHKDQDGRELRLIQCYLPTQEKSEHIIFEYKQISEFGNKESEEEQIPRTTARALFNYILQYSPDLPALFAIGLDYKTKLISGRPAANAFYILPPPPNCFELESTQIKVLNDLYKQLENLPKNHPNTEKTRRKFDELKHLYHEMTEESNLSLQTLLDKISIHRTTHNALFDVHRSQSMVSRFAEMLGFKKGAEQAYEQMEQSVHQEIERVNNVHANRAKGADEQGYQSDEHRPPQATTLYRR